MTRCDSLLLFPAVVFLVTPSPKQKRNSIHVFETLLLDCLWMKLCRKVIAHEAMLPLQINGDEPLSMISETGG